MNVIYVVSTLRKSGPTNQLYNLIKHLDRKKFNPHLITLSPEPLDSRWRDYEGLGVKLHGLNLSRFQGMFFAKSKLKKIFDQLLPELIHTQGIRADTLVASLLLSSPHVATIHNFAPEDYLSKFGKVKGKLMVYKHFKMMRQTKHLIACSKTISHKLRDMGIDSFPIQNGVEIELGNSERVGVVKKLPKPIFISVGSLIPRKNMGFLIETFNKLEKSNKGSLVILGDGVLMDELKINAGRGVHLVGNVSNVTDYLVNADYFVSTSLSEGLPNTVLEALAAGVPAILSNIESHVEIFKESEKASCLVKLNDNGDSLLKVLSEPETYFDDVAISEAKRIANDAFSAKNMSEKYQSYYLEVINRNE